MSIPDEAVALIEEARRHAEALIRGTETGDADLLHDMAYALEAALSVHPAEETEWEYQVVDDRGRWQSDVPGDDPAWFVPSDWPDGFRLVRRRKAGPWVHVESALGGL